jgi:3-dehydroquinate synthetase
MGLPTALKDVGLTNRGSSLVAHMEQDKKREKGRTSFILGRGIGRAFVDNGVELSDVAEFLDDHG